MGTTMQAIFLKYGKIRTFHPMTSHCLARTQYLQSTCLFSPFGTVIASYVLKEHFDLLNNFMGLTNLKTLINYQYRKCNNKNIVPSFILNPLAIDNVPSTKK